MYRLLLIFAVAVAAPAQSFTILWDFTGTDGLGPFYGALVQGTDGNYYGTTLAGGPSSSSYGTIFQIPAVGPLTTLYTFMGAKNGRTPDGGLALGLDGNFYGTTTLGGGFGDHGTILKITPAGTLTTLYTFTGRGDGGTPEATLLLGANGNFYGTTPSGGAHNDGMIFEITPTGTFTRLHSFTGGPDGMDPLAGLVQGADGDFYGTTVYGGAPAASCSQALGCGTVFKITPRGVLTTLYSFTGGADGAAPLAPLILGTDDNFYGTAKEGGATACPNGCGTIFKITPSGTFTTLYQFTGGSDQGNPIGGLVQANDGNLYGTTSAIDLPPPQFGTVFQLTPAGVLENVNVFDGRGGTYPYAGLLQATNGSLYGTTNGGGTASGTLYGNGTIFSVGLGVPPLVEAVPPIAKAGSPVIILGSNLTGSTSVTFNGTPASFTVVSATEVTATVPAGATSGQLTVTTPGGTINGKFRVLP